MAIYYINDPHTVSYGDDMQPYIDNGYNSPSFNINQSTKNKHIYNIIDPVIFRNILGLSNKLFYVKPINTWSKTSSPKLFQNNIVRFENDIFIDNSNDNQCEDISDTIQQDIDVQDVARIIVNNSNVYVPNHIYIIKTC